MDQYTLYFDGSCWPNPGGTAAYGFALYKGDKLVEDNHAVVGYGPKMSNNVAEYAGLYEGLAAFVEHGWFGNTNEVSLHVKGDSQLVINQMNKLWGASKDKLYYPNYLMTRGLVQSVRDHGAVIIFSWIPREQNTECDELSKAHLN